MKKKILILIIISLLLSGCVKYDYTMSIDKDKSMDIELTIAANKTYLKEKNKVVFSENELRDYQRKGFTTEKYDTPTMEGYTLKKHIPNIDEYSSPDTTSANMNVFLKNQKEPFFKSKTGILKTYYTINMNAKDPIEAYQKTLNREETKEELTEEIKKGLELNYRINLPYPSKNNNATDKSNNNKKLTWDLTKISEGNNAIYCEFYLINKSHIYIGIILAVIIVILSITSRPKRVLVNKPISQIQNNNTPPINNQTNNMIQNTNITPNNNQNNNIVQNNQTTQIQPPQQNTPNNANTNNNQSSLEDFYKNN